MINDNNLKQEGGSGSTNLQAKTINIGLTYSDARQIAIDVFEANFIALSTTAANIAKQRAEELIDAFLSGLQKSAPESIKNLGTPAMQNALYSAQKGYAISGDHDVAEVLVAILIERATTPQRDLKQIVLEESLNVITKLTKNQLDTLTIAFLFRYTYKKKVTDLSKFDKYLKTEIIPFIDSLTLENSLFQHLEYCGCTAKGSAPRTLESIIEHHYRGIFSNGFSIEDFENKVSRSKKYSKYLIPCSLDNKKYQLSFVNIDEMERKLATNATKKVKALFSDYYFRNTMSATNIRFFLTNIYDFIGRVFKAWNNSDLKNMSLTSVGIALAQANYRRKTGITIDLGEWIK